MLLGYKGFCRQKMSFFVHQNAEFVRSDEFTVFPPNIRTVIATFRLIS